MMTGDFIGPVALVCPSAAPLRCGVADYAAQLAKALAVAGVDARLIDRPLTSRGQRAGWRALAGFAAVHVQYPAIGFGPSLVPHVLPLAVAAPVIVTLHEFSLVHRARRLASAAFAFGGHRLVFTTEAERSAFGRAFPWWRGAAAVIPIGSNIPGLPHDPAPVPTIAFFGHLKPNRCLDRFIAVAELAAAQSRPWRLEIIGSPAPGQAGWVAGLQARTRSLPLSWLVDLEPAAVAGRLCRAAVAYLPYADGASPRRGSLLAALGNGVPVVTTDGRLCPPDLAEVVRFADTADGVVGEIERLLEDQDLARRLSRTGRAYADRLRWPAIAAAHLAYYRSILAGARPAPAAVPVAGR